MTIFGITVSAATIWFVVGGILAIIEAVTLGLICIWFAGGAVGAAIAAMLGASPLVQIIVFLAVSAVLVAVTRPIAKKRFNNKTEKTNVDALIGQTGVVEEKITPESTGQVKADGKVWRAVCESGEIEKGAVVVIKSIKGVTIMVEEIGGREC